jgi:putative transposon-encoded protein
MVRPRKNPIQIDDQGNEYFDAVVMAQGNTGRVYPPKDWIGCRVRITKLD